MTMWVLNFWMAYMYYTNPAIFNALEQLGYTPYVCMQLTPTGMVASNACTEPMPVFGK